MAVFPLSLREVKKVWDGSQNPLDFLTPAEVKAAEIYASLALNPKDGDQRATFGKRFREVFGFALPNKTKHSIMKNPAWKAYARSLIEQTRESIMAKLESGAIDAFDDYLWSRKEAKRLSDYKEVRLGASDYLDRIGATRRVGQPTGGNVTIVIKGSPEATHATIMRQLPAVEAEIVEDESPN